MLEKYLSFTSTIEITCIINVFHISLIGPYDSMTDMNPEKQEVDDEVVDMRHQYQHQREPVYNNGWWVFNSNHVVQSQITLSPYIVVQCK